MIFWGAVLVLMALFYGGWYWISVCRARRRAALILRWIQSSLAGQGRVVGMRWLSVSRFKVSLRLAGSLFQQAWMLVELGRGETPLMWLWSQLTGQQDRLTFQADLDWAPAFSLDVHNFRWFARSSRKNNLGGPGWTFEQTGPFVISTRMAWPKEITSAMSSLGTCSREFLNVNFSRRSPHFSVTLPLESISPNCPTRAYLFDAVRELAANSLPSLF
jgi:hypothetical protein